MGEDLERVGRAGRPEHLGRRHAVGVDDLPLRGVDHRIGDEARPAGQVLHGDHRGGREQVGLAGADQAGVEQFDEAQARIGREMPAVEAAQAVDRDRLGLDASPSPLAGPGSMRADLSSVASGVVKRDAAGGGLPACGELAGLVAIGVLVRGRQSP